MKMPSKSELPAALILLALIVVLTVGILSSLGFTPSWPWSNTTATSDPPPNKRWRVTLHDSHGKVTKVWHAEGQIEGDALRGFRFKSGGREVIVSGTVAIVEE